MRVLLICRDMDCGGAQTHVLDLSVRLVRAGLKVCVASGGGALVGELGAAGVRHVRLPLESRDIASLYRLKRALKRLISEGFNVVHAHTRISAMLASGICRARGTCFVTTVHAHFKTNELLRRVCRWGEGQIAVSRDLYFYLLENATGVSARTIAVINNGIDTQKFSPENLNKPTQKSGITVLFLSRLDKSCSAFAYSLCRIAEQLFAKIPTIRIVIGGGGDALCEVRRLANEIEQRLGERVIEVVGRVDNVLDFLSRGDVFIGVSRAALEAMSCGIPTILGGDEGFLGICNKEILQRGEYSNFCCRGERKGSDVELLEAILTIAKMSEEQRHELGMSLRQYVCQEHSAEIMARKTVEFYREILNSRKKSQKEKTRGGVLLGGYYGFGNMGDELMLESAVRRAERELGVRGGEIQILSKSRKSPYCLCGARLVNRASPLAVLRAVERADAVVFGGGTLLQNRTSRRSLAYYLAILRYAQLCGKRTELWANGIGDVRGKMSRRAVARVLSDCDFAGVRDGVSMARARELEREFGVKISGLAREQDLAFDPLLYDDSEACASGVFLRLGLPEGKRFAVFSVMGTASKKQREYVFEYAKNLTEDGIAPIFVVMYPSQDLLLTRKLCERLGGVLAYPFGAEDIIVLMKNAELVFAMRYHALVLAHIADTHFVGFGDDDKIRSFCDAYSGEYFGGE